MLYATAVALITVLFEIIKTAIMTTLPACCETATIVYRQTISTMNTETCDVRSLFAVATVNTAYITMVTLLIARPSDPRAQVSKKSYDYLNIILKSS